MSHWLWLVAFLLLLPVLPFLLKSLLAFTGPVAFSGKQMLKQELKKLGIVLGEDCLCDIVDWLVFQAKSTTGGPVEFRAKLVGQISGVAKLIQAYLRDGDDAKFARELGCEPIFEALKKHNAVR
jgi:hypothetical protein